MTDQVLDRDVGEGLVARVVEAGGDADTNAAVAGAAVGAAGGDVDVETPPGAPRGLLRRDSAAIGPLLEAAVAGLC